MRMLNEASCRGQAWNIKDFYESEAGVRGAVISGRVKKAALQTRTALIHALAILRNIAMPGRADVVIVKGVLQ